VGVTKIRNLLLLIFCVVLSACQPSCRESCRLNLSHNAFVLDYKRGNCKDVSSYPNFELPKEYCLDCYSCKEGYDIAERATLKLSYPDFKPSKSFWGSDYELKDGEILIHIDSNCDGYSSGPLPIDRGAEAKRFAEYINKNIGYIDKGGKPQFAPVASLGNGIYFQKNIREPYMSGNASVYFYQDKDVVHTMFLCDGENYCFSYKKITTSNGAYSIEYRFKGIDYQTFSKLDAQVEKFVSDLYERKAPVKND
jgi:hypothetical protein